MQKSFPVACATAACVTKFLLDLRRNPASGKGEPRETNGHAKAMAESFVGLMNELAAQAVLWRFTSGSMRVSARFRKPSTSPNTLTLPATTRPQPSYTTLLWVVSR